MNFKIKLLVQKNTSTDSNIYPGVQKRMLMDSKIYSRFNKKEGHGLKKSSRARKNVYLILEKLFTCSSFTY